jgi:hypothetical protein
MKVKLNCFYGEDGPGAEVDVDDEQGRAMLKAGSATPASTETDTKPKPTVKPK